MIKRKVISYRLKTQLFFAAVFSVRTGLLAIWIIWFPVCLIIGPGLAAQPSRVDSLEKALTGSEGRERFSMLIDLSIMTAYSDPQRAKAYAEEALTIALDTDEPLLIVNALNTLAISVYHMGNYRESLAYLTQSIDLMETAFTRDTTNLELLYRMAVASNNASNVYKGMGEPAQAVKAILRAIRYLDILNASEPRSSKYRSFCISCLNNKGLLFFELKEIDKANTALKEALFLSRETSNKKGTAMSLNNLGLVSIEQEQFDLALSYYLEALEINIHLDDSISIAGTYNNIGLIHEKSGALDQAMFFYKKSLMITERLGYLFGVANTCINIGKVYIALNQYDSSLEYLERGLETARRSDLIDLQKDAYLNLSLLQEKSGNYHQALIAYQNYATLKDSIFNSEKSKQVADMEARYETEKKEQENILLRTDLRLQKTTQRLLILAIGALIMIALLLVFLWRYKSRLLRQRTTLYKQQQQLQALEVEKKEVERKRYEDQVFSEKEINRLQKIKLDEQNRKLAVMAIQVTVKNQILLSILHEIDLSDGGSVEDAAIRLKKISQTVRFNFNLDRDWEQFKMHFEEVHPDFFIRLHKTFPDLTSGEQKMCAYYRINLGTNEIAQILNITTAAVQKSRHRLRKKLGLDSDTDMADFMMKF